MSKMYYILVIDDEPDVIEVVKTHLDRSEYVLSGAGSLADAYARLQEERFDLVISDIRLGDGLGTEILEQERFVKLLRNSGIIFMTGYDVDQKRLGKIQLLEKPFRREELQKAVDRLLKPHLHSMDREGPLDALILEYGQEFVIEVVGAGPFPDVLDVNLIIEDDEHKKTIPTQVTIVRRELCGDKTVLTLDKHALNEHVATQIQQRMQKMQQAIMDFLRRAKGY